MILRRFNSQGIESFRENLKQCRENSTCPVNFQLLENSSLTEVIDESVEIESTAVFLTKGKAGEYLHALLDKRRLSHEVIMSDVGLWSWLSLFFFDSICPKDERSGRRSINSDYCYIYDPHPWQYYRHLLFVSWRVLDVTKPHHQPHRLITTTKISKRDNATTEIMKKLYLLRIPCIFEVLDRIYWNESTGKAYQGTTNRTGKGNLVNRFPTIIQQLEKTYDMQSLSADQLIDLLGEEFHFDRKN